MHIEFSNDDYKALRDIANEQDVSIKALITHTMKQLISHQEGKEHNDRELQQ